MDPVVIVGAGMAGYALARELRKRNAAAEIVLVTADAGEVYAKPTLSNAISAGKEAGHLVTASATEMAAKLRLRVLTHTPVRRIDCVARELDASGEHLRYGSLVLALGADPVRLPLVGDGVCDVLSVNHIADYRSLRRHLAAAGPGARVAILGAGLIGCELADDLLAGGYHVTLVDPNPRPLAALAGPALSTALADAWAGRALTIRTRNRAVAVWRTVRGYVLDLADGAHIQADLVISAVGLRPSIVLARSAGIATARGILVDAHGRTSAPHVYALGDCAEHEVDGSKVVLPFVAPLLAGARAIAATLAGVPTPIGCDAQPVLVKTPSRKLALMPPSRDVDGEWMHETVDGRIVERFIDRAGRVRGFGLSEPTAALQRSLLAELGQCRPALEPKANAG